MSRPSFEESLPIINQAIDRRKNKWTLNAVIYKDWNDIASELRLHIMKKWHLFDPERGKLQAWLDRLICHQIINKLESLYFQSVSPCVNCEFNLGDGHCSIWGSYSTECDLYDKYVKSGRSDAKNVKFPMSLTASINEDGHSSLSDVVAARPEIDLEDMAQSLHIAMSGILPVFDWKVYQASVISGMADREVAKLFFYDVSLHISGVSGQKPVGGAVRVIREINAKNYSRAQEIVKDLF